VKIIRDTVHGDIRLTDEEMRIVDTPEFQRLRGVRQLGTSNLVFPGAQHTRFEHSLGTCWITRRMVEMINRRADNAGVHRPIDAELARFLGFASLIHDITHIPFGHTFEDERRILPPHDKSRERLHYFLERGGLSEVLHSLGVREALLDFFTKGKQAKPAFAYQIVAGPVCADLLDYLQRDAHYCGLSLRYDERIFHYLAVEGDQLCFNLYSDRGFRADAWSELINLLRIRYHLTERVYYHHTKMVSGAMLSRLLEALLASGGIEISELYDLRDDGFLFLLQQRIPEHNPEFVPLLARYLSRKLYKRVYMVARNPLNPDYPGERYMRRFQSDFHLNLDEARSHLEKKLAKQLGISPASIIIYAPEANMRLKEARVMVRMDSGPLVSLADVDHPELTALDNRHQALWRFYVFMDRAHEDKIPRAGRLLEKEIGLPNQLELLNKGQLAFDF